MNRQQNYLQSLEKTASYTKTLNGAKTYSTSGDACLDFFAVAGGMRYRRKADQITLFDRAYIENPELAMKLLFHIRDIRGGMGEREMFRTLLRHVAIRWPQSAIKNTAFIAEFGRYDDLLCLFGTPAQRAAVTVIKKQLDRDLAALEKRQRGEKDAQISLLAKWLPSANTSSYRTRRKAEQVMAALGMDAKSYRKMLSGLRANIGLTERYLTQRKPEKIVYHAVPSGAMLKYRAAFARNDTERFSEYLDRAESGEEIIHTDTLFPYEIARPYLPLKWVCKAWHARQGENTESSCTPEDRVLDTLWNWHGTAVNQNNAISVVDTSGSMYWSPDKGPTPALFSQALGLYLAERCTGPFRGKLITFESEPHLMEVHGETLADKMAYIQSFPWGMSTNLEAVFRLILEAAVESGASGKEMPQTIYIFSDMEFNTAMRNSDETVFRNAREMFEEWGYRLPAIVFHNVNSWKMQVPVRKDTRGAALVSGQDVHSFQYPTDVNTTPVEHMLKVLNGRRYAMIHA